MFFKNLCVYQLTKPIDLTADELNEKIADCEFQPCASQQMESRGWCKPLGRSAEMFIHAIGQSIMVCQKLEKKVLPASAVSAKVNEKVYEREEQECRKLTRNEKLEIKDDVLFDLLPKALIEQKLTFAYFDLKNNYFIVDTSSHKQAENLCTLMRETLGSFPVIPLQPMSPPGAQMTEWIRTSPPSPLELGSSVAMENNCCSSNKARFTNHDVCSDEIMTLINEGMQVTELALNYQDSCSFKLTDGLVIKSLSFSDIVIEKSYDAEDAADKFDIDFSIMIGEIERLIAFITDCFGGKYTPEEASEEQFEMTGLNMQKIADSGDPVTEHQKQTIEFILRKQKVTIPELMEFLETDEEFMATALLSSYINIGMLSEPDVKGIYKVIKQ